MYVSDLNGGERNGKFVEGFDAVYDKIGGFFKSHWLCYKPFLLGNVLKVRKGKEKERKEA